MKVKLSRLCMEGNTINSFTLLRENEEHLTWEKFKHALLLQYGGTIYNNLFEELTILHQYGTMDISKFSNRCQPKYHVNLKCNMWDISWEDYVLIFGIAFVHFILTITRELCRSREIWKKNWKATLRALIWQHFRHEQLKWVCITISGRV